MSLKQDCVGSIPTGIASFDRTLTLWYNGVVDGTNSPFEETMENKTFFGIGCGFIIFLLLINATLGGLCFQYVLWSIFAKDIPWYGDAVAGLFGGQFTIPLTIVCWVVRLCGVSVPFVH